MLDKSFNEAKKGKIMETFLLVLVTSIISHNGGYDMGVEHQKYYDKMMREKVGAVIYQEGYTAAERKAEFDKQVKLINLGIDYAGGE